MPDTSLFGYQSDSPAARAAYDMMVMQDMGILDAPEPVKEDDPPSGNDFLFPGTYTPGRWF